MTPHDVQAVKADYDRLTAQFEPLLFLARSGRLQAEAVVALRSLVDRIDLSRIHAIRTCDEPIANAMFALKSLAQAMSAELDVYLLLKRDQPEKAWNRLIDAQEAIGLAMRAEPRLGRKAGNLVRLRELEAALFPPQTFTSAGLIARGLSCTICRGDYEACTHVAGRVYMGRLCSAAPVDVVADHLAVVADPVDRRCRFTSRGVPGVGMRNLMTWEIAPAPDGSETPEERMEAVMIVARDDG